MRLYHPDLGVEHTTASDDDHHLAVYFESGWKAAPEPEARPGYEPEPVEYAPVEADKPRGKTARKTATTD